MVSKKKLEWPPPGWKVDIKVKNGRKIKYYINSKSHQKFYSKPAVLQYIKDGCVKNEKSGPLSEHAKSSWKKQMHLVEANDFEWLPTGWVIERRIRKSGARQGTEYKCFIDPSTGSKFYSKPEVLRHIGSKQTSAGSSRQKGEGCNRHSPSKWSVDPQSAHKSNLEPKVSQISKTRVRKSLSSGKLKVEVEKTADEDLPSGWIRETRIKSLGNKVVRRDSFYADPDSRLIFRSKLEVLRYVETGVISKHAYQRRNQNFVGEDYAIGNVSTSSSSEREETPKSRTRKQLFSGEGCSGQSIPALPEAEGNEETGGRERKMSSRVTRSQSIGAFSPKQSALSPESASNSKKNVTKKPKLEKVSATNKTVGMAKHSPPEVQDADVKDAFPLKSDSSSALSEGVLLEEIPVPVANQDCNYGQAQTSKRKTKDNRLPCVPCRSSKRLAGVNVEVLFYPVPIEHALRATNRTPSRIKTIASLDSVPIELEENHQNGVVREDLNEDGLKATSNKSSSILPLPSVEPVSNEGHEKQEDCGMQIDLTCQEEKQTHKVKTAQGEQSSNKTDDFSFREENHCTLDSEAEIKPETHGEQPLNKIEDLISVEEPRHIDIETVLTTQDESLIKIDILPSQEEKQCILDVDTETMQGEQGNKIDELTTKNLILVDLNDLQMEAPPGFCENTKVEVPSITTKQILEHPTDTLVGRKVENVPKGRSILVERSDEQLGSSQRQAEQPQSEFCFSAPLWSDPCLEFAYKTLTGALPFDDNLAIQDYIQHQLRTSEQSPDMCAASINNDDTKMVSEVPEDVNLTNSNGFGSPELKQAKNK